MGQPRVVIIGAGIVGCAAADELTLRGWTDITVVDQGPLYETGGSSSHAPGLVFQTNPSKTMTEFAAYTARKYRELGCFRAVGGIEVAASPERWHDLRRKHGLAAAWGVESALIGPDECAERWPLLDPEKIHGGFSVPSDGLASTVQAGAAQARRAIDRGARFLGGHRVTGIEQAAGRVTGVLTSRGAFPADIVLCAAGFWGPRIGRMAGVTIPLQPLAHHYAWTGPVVSQGGAWPILRHQDRDLYFKLEEGGRIGIGSYAHDPIPVSASGDDALREFTREKFEPSWRDAVELIPALGDTKVEEGIDGVFSFTPDGMPLVGEAPELNGFWTAEAVWVTHSAGVARAVADWLVNGEPEMDLHECDLNRFEDVQRTPAFVRERGQQNFIEVYDIIHPSQPMESPRPLRTSPFYERHRQLGAFFLEAAGWERPQYFETNPPGDSPGYDEWWCRYRSPISAAEARATRERVALYDMTPLKRMEVSGRGAEAFLQRLTTGKMDKPPGSVTYTLLLQRSGGIRSDLTVARLTEERFQVAGNGNLDLDYLQRQAPADVYVRDITPGTCCLGVWGPLARDLVQPLSDDDFSHEGLGYFKCMRASVGNVPVIAMRVSYVGELGWELYTTADLGLKLWDMLHAAGQDLGVVAAGRGAFNSLRLEKGYRAWGTDMTTEHNPFEAGLGFAVRMKKDFTGRAALEGKPVRRRLVCLNTARPVLGNEPVHAGDRTVGYVTSADYGYAIGQPIAYAWVPPGLSAPGQDLEVSYFGERVPAVVREEPLYDPGMEKIKR